MMQPMVTRDELLRVPFSRMRLDPENERMDLGPIEWLINNIRNEGVKEPLWGYKGMDEHRKESYFVVNGSRRFAALKVIYAEGKGIDIIAPFKTFNPDKVNQEQRIVERLIRNEGLPYSRLEKAASIGKLSAYGWSNQKIAEELSMSITWVTDTLLLQSAPQRLKNIIAGKHLSASLAIDMIKKGEVETFLAQYSNGEYGGSPEPETEPDLTPAPTNILSGSQTPTLTSADTIPVVDTGAPKTKRSNNKITRKDLNELNSIKEFKSFARHTDPAKLSMGSERYFTFICQLLSNQLTHDQIASFFR